MSATHTLLIRTPEGIVFSQLLAGPVTRCLAWCIDLICIAVIASLLGIGAALVGVVSIELAQAVSLLLYFAVSLGYGMVMEWFWRGQTIGKRMMRLRVVDARGLRLHFSQVVIRNLLRAVDMLPGPYLVGGVACLLSRRAQRLGDLAANTLVIRAAKLAEPDLDQLLAGKYNSLRDCPHLAARLRQRISPQEAGIAMQTILRRDQLDPQARVELFGQIADHFRSQVEFPADAVEGLADEQFVRNVVDVLYRTSRTGLSPVPPTQDVDAAN
jgi:uncharacterized RDD family membrane protein YckC